MEITKKDIDSLNAVVTVAVKAEDYLDKVQKILNNYRKTANIPGFRKGHVPMGMVKKQYGKAVLVEEVNKILQDALHNYLTEEKLDVLGNPLPKNDTEIDWDSKDFTFDFELGLSPKFDVDVVGKKAITHYNIEADDKMVNDQVTSIRKQYGKLISKKEVEKGDEITGTFSNEEKEINKDTTFSLDVIKGKTQLKKIIGAKVGDILSLKTKNLFANDHQNQTYFGVSQDDAKGLDIEVNFELKEVNLREMAVLNQEFFDKIFGKDVVKSEDELKAKIKEDAEKQFVQQSDQKLMDEVVEFLQENEDVRIEVGGHTNGTPKHTFCDSLSRVRAKEVAQYLNKKGVKGGQLQFKGYGKRRPIADNQTKFGRKKNQRVEIKILSIDP